MTDRGNRTPTSELEESAGFVKWSKPAAKADERPGRPPLTLEAVVETARVLIAELGFSALSLRAVASRLGVTAPALYAHVDDKLDLLRRVGDDGFDRLMQRLLPLPDGDALDHIRHIAREYLDFARDNPELFRAMYLFRPELGGVLTGEMTEIAKESYSLITQVAKDAFAAGLLASDDPVLANVTLWSAVHGLTIVLVLGSEFGRDLEDRLMSDLVDTLLRGFAPKV